MKFNSAEGDDDDDDDDDDDYYYYYYFNNPCPSARCAYAANAVGKDLDIFAIGAFSLNHIYSN
jgi:hypothetical protein